MPSVSLWASSAEILFLICEKEKPAGFSFSLFHGKGRNGKQHLLALAPLRGAAAAAAEGPSNRRNEKMRLAKRLAFFRFDFSFGIIKGEQPLIRGSSASKSLRPCRAEHAAFASQTGLRLKSPTGAFMPCGHRRPFWFSFGAKREHLRRQRTFIKNIHVFQMQNPAEMKAASGLFWQGSQSKPAQNPKIRASAHFNTLKTYKSAKIFFYFLVRLLGGLRLLCGQNLLL